MAVLQRPWGHMHFRDVSAHDGRAGAPAIVFASSLGTDMRMWDGVSERLPGYRRIGFDMRGHGLSATPSSAWTVEDLASDVVALMDHLELARSAIVGCSIGGLIGQAMGIHHGSRCSALVLSNTASKVGTAETWAARIAAVEQGGMAGVAETILERSFAPEFRSSLAAAPWRTMLLRNFPPGYIGTCRALAAVDLTAGLGAIAAPTLMLAGPADQSTPVALVMETAAKIPGARVHVIAATGHLPAIDAPEETARVIADFLKDAGHV